MHPDIPEEQAYFDRALELRDRLEVNLGRGARSSADPKTAAELRRRVGALGIVDPGVAVAFGRIDAQGSRWYIGRGAIWDEDGELVVVNWQAPIAAPFYRATPEEPQGLDARRIYRCAEGNRILDIEEMVFDGLEAAVLSGHPPAPPGPPRAPVDPPAPVDGPRRLDTGPVDTTPAPRRSRSSRRPATNGDLPVPGRGVASNGNGRVLRPPADPSAGDALPPTAEATGIDPEATGIGPFDGTADSPEPPGRHARSGPQMTDALLDALSRTRSGELADIVATIQAAQYDIITRDIEQLLVVQGGPGTGKTVVGLHRVSWMLYNRQESWQPNDVLVVGPNPAFIRYISAVLPSLGDEAVVQLPVTGLGPPVKTARVDPVEVRRLKGDRRMQRLLLRAVRNRQRPQRGPVDLEVAGRTVRLDGDRIVARARQLAGEPHNEARRALRSFIVDEVQTFFSRRGLRGLTGIEDLAQSEATRQIDNYLERIWPSMTPQAFVVDLFSTRRRLEAAGVGLLTAEEISMLSMPAGTKVSSATWAVDDVPLLDLADMLLNGTPATYEHILVDEAQDLSPMQFESIRRRSRTGWMTVLGDLAQATSPWAPGSWEEAVLHLRRDQVPTEIAELTLGYRLPQEVHDVAMRLLPEIAPRLTAPRALRSSGQGVALVPRPQGDLAGGVIDAVRELAGTGLTGVVVPRRHREEVEQALDGAGADWAPELQARAAPVVVLEADEVKGLEFDNVVVVEPAEIARATGHGSGQGLRTLFVALTRTTHRLTLVHAQPLPPELGLEGTPAYEEPVPPAPRERPLPEPRSRQSPPVPAPAEPDGQDPAGPWAPATPPAGTAPALAGGEDHAVVEPEALVALDRAMARSIAQQLAETLSRYVTPALVPLVLEEMRQMLDARGRGQAPGRHVRGE